ncbi:TPA: hypothetical protein DF272_02745 [Candidatus Falkowbacteria bacterium]|nr:hypothetical protein [Candidatus Falkowbacteria bacterium]
METKPNSSNKMNFFMGFFAGLASVSVIGFFVLLVMIFTGNNDGEVLAGARAGTADNNDAAAAEIVDEGETAAQPVRSISEDDHYTGNLNAPVQLIIYDDFECPFCLRHEETVKQIRSAYGDDQVAIAYRHFPLSFHASAQKAAEASECAAEQGKFFEMADELFALQGLGTMSVDNFKAAAKKLGLNTSKFNTCLDDGQYAQKIRTQLTEGVSFGVQGTPGNFLNGQLVSGAVPFEQFQAAIDSILAQ